MNSICCSLAHGPAPSVPSAFEFGAGTQTTLATRAAADISLVTADGDKVTLSTRSAFQSTHLTYDYLGRIQGQAVAVRAEKLQFSVRSEIAISVQGELDQEELADIKKLLHALEKSAADLFSGQSRGHSNFFVEAGNFESITSFEADLSFSREVSLMQAGSLAGIGPESGSGGANITAVGVDSVYPGSAERFLDKLAKAMSRLEHVDKIPERFAELIAKLTRGLALDEHQRKLVERIESELLRLAHSRH